MTIHPLSVRIATWNIPTRFKRRYPTPSPQTKSILREILEQAFNEGNLAVVDELVAPDTISHHLSWGMPANRMGLKQLIAMFRTAFPDLSCTLEDEIVQGDTAAAHWTMRGTHQGPFLGNPPTHKSIVVPGITYARMRDNQIVENWTLVDQMGVLQQLGLIPPPR